MKKRIIVIGGGPGGYVAAIRAAQLGASVTVVEKDALGGTCLNRGCIPTKVFLHTAELYGEVLSGAEIGLVAEGVSVDWNALLRRKKKIVSGLVGGVGYLLKANGVTVVPGAARFSSAKEIEVTDGKGNKQTLTADAFIIAVGSEPAVPPVPGFDLPGILTSNEALELSALPESMLLVGGGVIGIEFASVFTALGVKVTVVEMLPEILPNFDAELAGMLKKQLTAKGVVFMTSAGVTKVEASVGGFSAFIENKETKQMTELTVEKVFVCVGRRPGTSALSLENAAVKTERGRICVDERMRTSETDIYAIGDCASPIMLAHVASREGEIAAENIMGEAAVMHYDVVPSCVYTTPELASVGMTDRQAREKGYDVQVGTFSLSGNGKSKIMGQSDGVIKIVSEKKYGEVLGVQILGPRATDLIAEGALAMRAETTVDEIIDTIHAHPTVGEAMGEAALAVYDRSIHMPPKKRI